MPEFDQIDANLYAQLGKLNRQMMRRTARLLQIYRITPQQFVLMTYLRQHEEAGLDASSPVKIDELVGLLGMPHPSILQIIVVMMERGLLEQTSRDVDEMISVRLTSEAQLWITDIIPYHEKIVADIFAVLLDDEREMLLSLIGKLLKMME